MRQLKGLIRLVKGGVCLTAVLQAEKGGARSGAEDGRRGGREKEQFWRMKGMKAGEIYTGWRGPS